MSIKQLSRYQAYLIEFFLQFHFVIQYRLGKWRANPDALNRSTEDLTKECDTRLQLILDIVLKPHNLDLSVKKDLFATSLHIRETENAKNEDNFILEDFMDRGYQKNPLPSRDLQLLTDENNYSKDLNIIYCSILHGKLYNQNRLYVPHYHALRFPFCCLYHDFSYRNYFGIDNTNEQLYQNYEWANMQGFIRKYICYYETYKHIKGS